jgi:hypothetical protein
LRSGDRVEVYAVWAAQGFGRPPLMRWGRGYTFVRTEDDTAIVKHDEGVFAGVEVRHPRSHVRAVNESKEASV